MEPIRRSVRENYIKQLNAIFESNSSRIGVEEFVIGIYAERLGNASMTSLASTLVCTMEPSQQCAI